MEGKLTPNRRAYGAEGRIATVAESGEDWATFTVRDTDGKYSVIAVPATMAREFRIGDLVTFYIGGRIQAPEPPPLTCGHCGGRIEAGKCVDCDHGACRHCDGTDESRTPSCRH